MIQQAVTLMNVLVPPGNRWLMELSHRKTGLPAGVHIVRFYGGSDDMTESDEDSGTAVDLQDEEAAWES